MYDIAHEQNSTSCLRHEEKKKDKESEYLHLK